MTKGLRGYTLADLSGLIGLSPHQIRGYVRSGVLQPQRGQRREYRFSFQDVVLLRTAKGLLDARVTARRAKRVLRKLKNDLADVRSLSAVRIEADGQGVVVHEDDLLWNIESGQGHLNFAVRDLASTVASIAARNVTLAELDGDMSSDDWYNLGLDLEDISPKDACVAYEHAVRLDVRNADAHVNVGRLLQMQGNFPAAARHYEQAIEAAPEHELAHYNLGTVHDEQQRRLDAIACYQKAPNVADAHYNLARLYEIGGDELSALRHFRKFQTLEAAQTPPKRRD